MRIEICQSYEALSLKAKEIVTSELGQHKALTLCAATGGSPTRMYELLVEEAGRQPELFSQFTVLKLDEWGGITMDHPGTCESYLRRTLSRNVSGSNRYWIKKALSTFVY